MKKLLITFVVALILFIGIPMIWNFVSPWLALILIAIVISAMVLGIENKLNRNQ